MKSNNIPRYFTKTGFFKDPLNFRKYINLKKDVVFQGNTSEEIHCFYDKGQYVIILERMVAVKNNYLRYKYFKAFEKKVIALSKTFSDVKVQQWK